MWADVLGTAWLNARPFASYLAFMFVAGVIACYGVIDGNTILIVGAMAVSPDLLPITAISVGIVGRRPTLAGRALLTLALGLAVASAAAAIFALAQDQFDLIPAGFDLQETGVLGSLTSVNDETIAVALAAGVAGMLALETRASSGVGVAISVTTIPAAAYLGVAAGLGEFDGVRRRTGRARHERRDDGGGRGRHARTSRCALASQRPHAASRRPLKASAGEGAPSNHLQRVAARVLALGDTGAAYGAPSCRRSWRSAAASPSVSAVPSSKSREPSPGCRQPHCVRRQPRRRRNSRSRISRRSSPFTSPPRTPTRDASPFRTPPASRGTSLQRTWFGAFRSACLRPRQGGFGSDGPANRDWRLQTSSTMRSNRGMTRSCSAARSAGHPHAEQHRGRGLVRATVRAGPASALSRTTSYRSRSTTASSGGAGNAYSSRRATSAAASRAWAMASANRAWSAGRASTSTVAASVRPSACSMSP